jgi:hypothetical protein
VWPLADQIGSVDDGADPVIGRPDTAGSRSLTPPDQAVWVPSTHTRRTASEGDPFTVKGLAGGLVVV